MQKNIHPNWNNQATVTCACGNSFTTGSIQDSIQLDLCNKCHPFFTGEMKFVDTQGRVDKFMQKMAKAKKTTNSKSAKKVTAQQEDQKSYKQLLQEQRSQVKKAA